jgi:Domain of unknown function (DUF4136)
MPYPQRILRCSALLVFGAALLACATPQPEIRTRAAPDAVYSSYSTFGFPEQTGTDRGGYSTIVTDYFKQAVRDQMQQRGFRYVEASPDLIVNFYANVRERTEVRTRPGVGHGYYGYRFGLYDVWPLYNDNVESVTYPVGTANIDIVDAKRKQLIWEGIAEGRISDKAMDQPRETIASVVAQVFQRFNGRAGAVENQRAQATDSGL